jgi:valyl-tRNA synthetase
MPRAEFVKLCLEVTARAEEQFKDLWTRFGFSCDWSLLYTPIDPWVQRISQRSFLDLVRRNRVYRKESPTLWCPECGTAVAQAETEDRELPGFFHDLLFPLADGSGNIPIGHHPTGTPSACVAVFVNPGECKVRASEGRPVRVPLFDREVAVHTDPAVDMEKGSGAVIAAPSGTRPTSSVAGLRFGTEDRPRQPGPHEREGRIPGGDVLEEGPAGSGGTSPGGRLRPGGREITHPVNAHERCGTPLEYLVNEQWFIRILDMKEDLLARAEALNETPATSGSGTTTGWRTSGGTGAYPDSDTSGFHSPVVLRRCGSPVFASEDQLPVDPLTDSPEEPCPDCGCTNFLPRPT